MNIIIQKSTRNGAIAVIILFGVYVAIVSLISGWNFMLLQFSRFWYFIVTLALGFGIQVSLYTYFKNAIKQNTYPHVLAVSGTATTAAMISCCAHYLVNLLPILGAVGVITVISQYQVQLFWVGLAFNLIGILYMINRIIKYTHGL